VPSAVAVIVATPSATVIACGVRTPFLSWPTSGPYGCQSGGSPASNSDVRVGAQFVVYRNKGEAQNFLFELGDAVAVNVGQNFTTLQVTLARDAFQEGDLVAERKEPTN